MPDTDASPTNDSAEPQQPRRTEPLPWESLVAVHPGCQALGMPGPGESLGRSWLATRGIQDRRVSDQHVLFVRRGGELRIADANSTHGTWLNGALLTPGQKVPLADGAVIRIAGQVFVYREEMVGPADPDTHEGLVSPFGLRRVLAVVARMKPTVRCNVLIEGETGSGKEVMAKYIARRLGRPDSFEGVNVAALPANIIESLLFGQVEGAFTGATTAPGLFVGADGGALLLDEIGDLAIELQVKLLRVVEERLVRPIGGTRPRPFDAQLFFATNRSLDDDVGAGKFREDLYHRIAELVLEMPPLRDRKEDIPALVRHLLACGPIDLDPARMNADAIERLLLHPWSGNVRELRNTLRRIASVSPGPLVREAVDVVLGALDSGNAVKVSSNDDIQRRLSANGGNIAKTARELGIPRNTFKRRLASIEASKEIDYLLDGMRKPRGPDDDSGGEEPG